MPTHMQTCAHSYSLPHTHTTTSHPLTEHPPAHSHHNLPPTHNPRPLLKLYLECTVTGNNLCLQYNMTKNYHCLPLLLIPLLMKRSPCTGQGSGLAYLAHTGGAVVVLYRGAVVVDLAVKQTASGSQVKYPPLTCTKSKIRQCIARGTELSPAPTSRELDRHQEQPYPGSATGPNCTETGPLAKLTHAHQHAHLN